MILATIGSNYSLETNSLAVRRRKYLLNYLPEDGPRPVLAVMLNAGYSAGKKRNAPPPSAAVKTMHSDRAPMCNYGIMVLFLIRHLAIIL